MHLYFLLCTSAFYREKKRAKVFLSASWIIKLRCDMTHRRKKGAALRVPQAHKSVYYNNVVSGHSRSLLREMGTQERALSFNRENSRGRNLFSFFENYENLERHQKPKLFQTIRRKIKIIAKFQSNIACIF